MTAHPNPLDGRMAACAFGMERLIPLLQAFTKEIEGVRHAQDLEHIHHMRVASRRLRAALPLFSACFPKKEYARWMREIRRITRALGEARDADVQIDFLEKLKKRAMKKQQRSGSTETEAVADPDPVVVLLLRQVRKRRQALQKKVIAALDALEQSGIIGQMNDRMAVLQVRCRKERKSGRAPAITAVAASRINRRLGAFLAFGPWVHNPDAVAQHHATRIAAKKLRYTMEVYAPLYRLGLKKALARIRKMQDILGEMHDRDVWIDTVTLMLVAERSGLRSPARLRLQDTGKVSRLKEFLAEREKERRALHRRFRSLWDSLQRSGLWVDVRAALDAGRRKRYRLDASLSDDEVRDTLRARAGPDSGTVTALALQLFDGLRPIHGLGLREQFWLECAGRIHAPVIHESQKGSARRTGETILSDEHLLLPLMTRGAVALIAASSRGKFRPESRGFFTLLPVKDRNAVRMLAAIIRLADALDTSRTGAVGSVTCTVGPRQVIIELDGTGDISAEIPAALATGGVFKKVFDRELVVR